MRSFVLAVLFFTPSALFAATKPNPADYTLTVHVQCSFTHGLNERIVVDLEGKQMELSAVAAASLPLALGDYKARLLKDTSPDSYEVGRRYELLFPDGKIRAFYVTGVGTALCGSEGQ
jgi:hypothetical protein